MRYKVNEDYWFAFRPYKEKTKTDKYYLKVCDDLKEILILEKAPFYYKEYLDEDRTDVLACFLTSYFEDIISGTNIWNTFVKTHKEMYNKPLPFYELDDYKVGGINKHDISFLIWYYFHTTQPDGFLSPYYDFQLYLSEIIMDFFIAESEVAPINRLLNSCYSINSKEKDYYTARKLIDNLFFNSYLFHSDTAQDFANRVVAFSESVSDENDFDLLINETKDTMLNISRTKLLNLTGKEWIAKIIGERRKISKHILNISPRVSGFFYYRGQDRQNIYIEHIASNRKFTVTKESFDHSGELKANDNILYMGLSKWMKEWWFSGMFFQQPFDADLILDLKDSVENRAAINFLDHEEKKEETINHLKLQFEVFKKFNNGSPIAFLPTDQIDEFTQDFLNFFNESLDLSQQEIDEAIQRARKDGCFGTDKNNTLKADKNSQSIRFNEPNKTGLVFFNPNRGIEVAIDINSAFPLPSNPFFKPKDSEEHIIHLLMVDNTSSELAMYCIDNCSAKLPIFKTELGNIYLENIDFLLSFWKPMNYRTNPSISFIGVSK